MNVRKNGRLNMVDEKCHRIIEMKTLDGTTRSDLMMLNVNCSAVYMFITHKVAFAIPKSIFIEKY